MIKQETGNREEDSRFGWQTQPNEVYQQAIDILTSQGKFYINLGLERVQKILGLLSENRCRAGMPDLLSSLKFIHVAGTNGKGSVCAMLSAILKERGNRKEKRDVVNQFPIPCYLLPSIGLFTSPHVFEYTERIKINDVEIEKEIFAQKIIKIVELAQKNDIHLTEFEILTIVAFEYFAENNVDIVILETGLGGRLDATNVIKKNICSIITNIDFDHTERLGDTIEKITAEKAGIIKENCPVVISKNNAGLEIIKKVAKEKNASLFTVLAPSPHEGGAWGELLSLKGTFQKENLALVLTVIEILNKNKFNISQKMIENGLTNIKHPCRFEHLKNLKDGYNILIDGAHNPNGAKALRKSLDYYYPNKKFKFIFGCLKNKDYQKMMKNLFTTKNNLFEDEIYFYHFDNPNSCSYEELASICEFNSKPFKNFKDFDIRNNNENNNTLIVICGSFYMIKELLKKMDIK